jgi:hypothetical protein
MMTANDLIIVTERLGLPAVMMLIGAFLYWQAQKQSAKRDSVNADLHKSHIRLQDEQNKILEKLTSKMVDGDESIEKQIDNAKSELVKLITSNHQVVMTNHTDIINEIAKIPNLMTKAQEAHDKTIQTGLQSLVLDVTKAIQEAIRKENKHEQNSSSSSSSNSVNRHGVDG